MILRPRVSEQARFPPTLQTIAGDLVDIPSLASHHLITITLKAPWCPVCPELLSRLLFLGLSARPSPEAGHLDPFTGEVLSISPGQRELNSVLLREDTRFLVICPGTPAALAKIRADVGWDGSRRGQEGAELGGEGERADATEEDECVVRAPFVNDPGLTIAKSLGLAIPGGVWPSILHILPTLEVETVEIGRSPGYYGDHALLMYLRSLRAKVEKSAIPLLTVAQTLLTRLVSASMSSYHYNFPAVDRLPVELVESIFSFLSIAEPKDLIQAGATCRSWRFVALKEAQRRLQEGVRRAWVVVPRRRKAGGELVVSPLDEDAKEYPDGTEIAHVALFRVKKLLNELRVIVDGSTKVVDALKPLQRSI
ncbi:hypothetical protein HK104_009992 [Borealophlyctis nickersoniae]|nr:hypothetical protein HK104_009992 [Borealophlyctis nickersoniae]